MSLIIITMRRHIPLRTLVFRTISNGTTNRRILPQHRAILNELRRRHDIREEFHQRFLIELRSAIGARDIPQEQEYNPSNVVHLVAEGDLGGCAICQENIKEKQNFVRLHCSELVNHMFHKECIMPWLNGGHSSCPRCRSDLSKR